MAGKIHLKNDPFLSQVGCESLTQPFSLLQQRSTCFVGKQAPGNA